MDEILQEFNQNWIYRKITRSLIKEIECFIKSKIQNDFKVIIEDNALIIQFEEFSLTN